MKTEKHINNKEAGRVISYPIQAKLAVPYDPSKGNIAMETDKLLSASKAHWGKFKKGLDKIFSALCSNASKSSKIDPAPPEKEKEDKTAIARGENEGMAVRSTKPRSSSERD
ncbi:hypothetical protein [Sneathiella limimaris]|uniref:hypothetical protein n=1 Tax=Sneathiella limimaris TaxID=1964213 RepID=UPI00146AC515|nr:hypothetical protein [Sneathiella limimaris]